MSPRRNWDSPNPSPAGECTLRPGPKGGGGAAHYSQRLRGWGSSNSDWRKSLALCLLCGYKSHDSKKPDILPFLYSMVVPWDELEGGGGSSLSLLSSRLAAQAQPLLPVNSNGRAACLIQREKKKQVRGRERCTFLCSAC
jgi:hypothetical protein